MASFDKIYKFSQKLWVGFVWKRACRSERHFWRNEFGRNWGSIKITLFKRTQKDIPVPSPGIKFISILTDIKKTFQTLSEALLKIGLARVFHRSRFQKSPSLVESGHWTKTTFDRFWSKKQRFFYIEGCYTTGTRHSDRVENTKSVGEYRRTLALLIFQSLTKNSFSEDGDYRQNLSPLWILNKTGVL